MSGKAILIVGARGMGKSTMLKSILKNAPRNNLKLYDVNNEHSDLYPFPLPDFRDFISTAQKLRNAIICCEEATIFLNNKSSNTQLIDIMVRLRHTNNTLILVFHSLRAVPRYVFDLSTNIILFKTNDNFDLIDSRFENQDLNRAFLRIKKSPMLKNKIGKEYSPCLNIDLMT